MNIECDTRIPFPRPLVFQTYRDQLLDLIPYLPNVRDIEIKSRRDVHGQLFCINHWHGGGEIPAIARSILSDEMLSWTEHNIWDSDAHTLVWRIETHAFTKAVSCGGENRFVEDGSYTVVENRGRLTIDPQQLEGIPDLIRGHVASVVENYLSQKIAPNLLEMSQGVQRYLEASSSSNQDI
ncbi:MAG: hypothetical protein AAF329_00170 [Cyanobacteria bacterium P01_A01_bin.17]